MPKWSKSGSLEVNSTPFKRMGGEAMDPGSGSAAHKKSRLGSKVPKILARVSSSRRFRAICGILRDGPRECRAQKKIKIGEPSAENPGKPTILLHFQHQGAYARFRKLRAISIMLQQSQIYAQLLSLTCDLGAKIPASVSISRRFQAICGILRDGPRECRAQKKSRLGSQVPKILARFR